MKKISIAAIIIAKNESKNIKRCINSVLPFCRQIVLVDTGSDDDTAIIASQIGIDIYFHKWNNDFSDARNFAISHVYTDWIISIDADEELDNNSFNMFIKNNSYLFNDTTYGGISIIINNFLDANLETSSKHRFTRIFRNHNSIKFERKIHEQVADSILNENMLIFKANIILNHFGYIDKNLKKIERNRQLIEENIENDFDLYHLANTEFSAGNIDKALNIYHHLIHLNSLSDLQQITCKIRLGQIYLKKSDYYRVLNDLDFLINDLDLEGLRQSIIATAYLMLKDYQNAEIYYKKYEINNSTIVEKSTIDKAMAVIKFFSRESFR